MRRTIMRYVNLSYAMILSMVSTRVKKRFPTLDHLVEAGMFNLRSSFIIFYLKLISIFKARETTVRIHHTVPMCVRKQVKQMSFSRVLLTPTDRISPRYATRASRAVS